MRSHALRLRGVATGAVVLALVAATGSSALAGPPAASGSPDAAPAGATASAADPASSVSPVDTSTGTGAESPLSPDDAPLPGSRKVTLLTGDVVSYLPGKDGGAPQVRVAEGGRPGAELVSFTTFREADHYYVFPSDARALVGTGTLDRSLFDVAYLVENGYADDESAQLPVIVQYPAPARPASTADATALSTRADALPATTGVKALPAVHATTVKVTKSQAGRFWASVDAPKPDATRLDAGVSKIWLDHRTRAVLDQSVPQIGAPEAWAAGYDGTGVKVAVLDTGIDATHPDLSDRVIASKSFVDGESVQDGHGHGTHVASTIVGSGAASGGKYKGVAPGARLLVGKVMGNNGFGSDSDIIAGMQWAVEQGAKVVSISIGGNVTDGTDPMSQTVNELSARYGTLFVIAAGNTGPNYQQINAPGTADAALTVAAVDKQDQMANFSSRGPRLGDSALKPDIAAPGVNITAAKAEGTAAGPIVDEKYTTISGTSMATPHVAGAAAILAQEHPDWSGQKLKQVLTSTATDDGFSAYSQGSGRVDLARATTQQVYTTGNVDFGKLAYPQTDTVSRPLTYVNDGDTPVTLNLRTKVIANATSTPEGMLAVNPATVTVPAHGTTDTTVTFDATRGPITSYGGAVEATDASGAVAVRTAVGAVKQAKQVTVTVRTINRSDATDVSYGGYLALRLDDQPGQAYLRLSAPVQEQVGVLDAGYYSIATDVVWRDGNGEFNKVLLVNPTVDATRDVTVTFDLRKAQPLAIRAPDPTVSYHTTLSHHTVTEGTKSFLDQFFMMPYNAPRLWSLPTGRATRGEFTAYSQFMAGADPVAMTARGVRGKDRAGLAVHPYYQAIRRDVVGNTVQMFDGRSTRRLVAAGHGTPAELAGVDVSGALVLLDLSDLCPVENGPVLAPCTVDGAALDRVTAAKEAGAVGVVGYGSLGRQFLTAAGEKNSHLFAWAAYPIPTVGLRADEGRALAAMLARGPVDVDVNAVSATTYLYSLAFVRHDTMPAGTQTVTAGNLRRIENRLHADAPAAASFSIRPVRNGNYLWSSFAATAPAPGTLTTYVGPVGREIAWQASGAASYTENNSQAWSQRGMDVFDRAGRETRDWGEAPFVPNDGQVDRSASPLVRQFCWSCRSGDTLSVMRLSSNNGRGSLLSFARNAAGRWNTDLHLYTSDGAELPMQEGLFSAFTFQPYYVLPAERTGYRMTEAYQTPFALQRYARTVQTERTFTSERRDDGIPIATSANVGDWCSGWLTYVRTGDRYALPPMQPCQPTGELYLGYDFGLGLDNTLPAGSQHTVTLTGLHSSYLTPEPALTRVRLEVSFDDGTTWRQVTAKRGKDGTWKATYDAPALAQTTGAVSVRVDAADAAGNTIKQTVPRAYGLSADRSPGGGHGHGQGGAMAL